LIWLIVNKVCSTRVLLVITRSEKIMLISNEVAFSFIFLYQTYIEQGGKPEMIKFMEILLKLKMEDKKSLINCLPACCLRDNKEQDKSYGAISKIVIIVIDYVRITSNSVEQPS